jgi:hypothetical protein
MYHPYDQAGTYWTALRDAEIRVTWPTWTPDTEVQDRLNAMPGRQIEDFKNISRRAFKLCVFRPGDFAQERKRQSALIGAAKAQARRAAGEIPPIPHPKAHGPEFCTRVAELWAEGYSASAIGRQMGVTKGVICGLRGRLHLASRATPIRAKQAPRLHRAKAVTLPPLMPTAPPLWFFPSPEPMSGPAAHYAFPKPHQCRFGMWQNGAKPTQEFCCKPCKPGSSWCPSCRAVVFQQVTARVAQVAML